MNIETNDVAAGVDSTIYFAEKPFESPEFAAECFAYAEAWVSWVEDTGIATRWTQNACLYAGVDPGSVSSSGMWDQDSFSVVGDNGELMSSNYNDARNLIQHILVMTCATPPNIIAKAINDDSASLIAAQAFEGLFSYYMTTHKSGRLLKQSRIAVEYALVQDTGYFLAEWDRSAGAPSGIKTAPQLDPMTGTMTEAPITDERGQQQLDYEGDLYFKARSPFDVFFDPGAQDEDECDWALVRDQVNKFELAKRVEDPEVKRRILMTSPVGSGSKLYEWRRGFMRPSKTNLIDVWKFYHRPTPSMPKGRYALILDGATVIEDGPNPYDRIPLFSVKAMEGLGTVTGYAPMNLAAPIQQSRNVLSSAMMTNFAMFGVQNVAVKDADQFDVTEIAGSMNVLRYSDTAPAALQLGAQMNGIDEHYDRLGTLEETLTGVNSVIRGDPETSLKSGKALGIVQAAGVQYNSALAASYAQFLKDVGNFMLFCFRNFLKSERITQIVGENDKMQSVTWDADTFGPIDRVEAELTDPAKRTLGYKTDLGMFMVQSGLTTTPQEFITVVTTGQLKPLYRSDLTELNLIHQENDEMIAASKQEQQWMAMQQQANMALMQGNLPAAQALGQQMQQLIAQLAPPVKKSDNDELHKAEHKIVCATPSSRRNAFLSAIYDYHDMLHEQNIVAKATQQAQQQIQVQAQTTAAAVQAGLLPQAQPQQGQEAAA